MTIYLFRHGEIESDGVRRFFGQTNVRLSKRGVEQAKKWQNAFTGTPFDAIYTSDLSRCAETARIISGGDEAKVRLVPELREINLGKMEGFSMTDFRKQYHDVWKSRGKDIAGFIPEGGESFFSLQRRVMPVFEALSRRHDGNIVMVAHAGVNRVILCHILEMPLSNLFKIDQSYGCLNLLEPYGNGFRVTGMNLTAPPCSM